MKRRHKQAVACMIMGLPAKEEVKAAEYACSVNPANAPAMMWGDKWLSQADEQAIAVLTTKWWGASGARLTVGFVSQAPAALQEKIVSHFNLWGKWCNASFTIVQGAARNADVRISLGAGGYWSYLGTDISRVPSAQQTMNLQGFSLDTPDTEYVRVLTHEIGHTLGCPHEHMRASIINRLDYEKTVRYMRQTQGWSEQQVVSQVFTPLDERSIRGTGEAHEDSIMCYWFPPQCTKDGRPITGGSRITKEDGEFMGTIYPLAVQPPPSGVKATLSVDGYKPVTVNLDKL